MNALSFTGHCDCCGPTIVRYYSPGSQYSHVMPYCDQCDRLAYVSSPVSAVFDWGHKMDEAIYNFFRELEKGPRSKFALVRRWAECWDI